MNGKHAYSFLEIEFTTTQRSRECPPAHRPVLPPVL